MDTILPTSKGINSSKGDALPNLSMCFDAFAELQYQAMIYQLAARQGVELEDYFQLLQTVDLADLSFDRFREKLFQEISTHHRIAYGMGFSKVFNKS